MDWTPHEEADLAKFCAGMMCLNLSDFLNDKFGFVSFGKIDVNSSQIV